MKIDGDPEGIAILKELHAENKEFLKQLIGEARTNTDQQAQFQSKDGTKRFVLKLNPASGELIVEIDTSPPPKSSRVPE